MGKAVIRRAIPADAQGVCRIYNPYVESTAISFEEVPVDAGAMAARIADIQRAHAWLVAEVDGEIAGYAYAGPWRSRAAYRHAVETTVYVESGRTRQGLGRALYETLLAELARMHFHCAIGGIALPNPASVSLHEKLGFVKVAHFREVGWKLGRWVDVGYWQRNL
jgi:phosphinothricin acetyltransferase